MYLDFFLLECECFYRIIKCCGQEILGRIYKCFLYVFYILMYRYYCCCCYVQEVRICKSIIIRISYKL
jgi:hypothetical protein